ncbi:hypothetical protein TIFTF001_050924 [Ficus carica]|uniref:Uncharacterized protein n=1 Tax=Ficus carica TaxID=3494 RepID=A0AA87Z5U3_FICCA|nr:hypothetical protein TIFTF001_050924 [Ficus carica]
MELRLNLCPCSWFASWCYLVGVRCRPRCAVTSGVEGAASYLTEAGLEQVRTEGERRTDR